MSDNQVDTVNGIHQDHSSGSVLSGASNIPNLMPGLNSELTAIGLQQNYHSHFGLHSSMSTNSQSSQTSLHTHSKAHTTTNISLYPPPNPLAKPILPVSTGLSKIVPISNNNVSTSQPGNGGRSWTHKTTATTNNLGSVNERTVPSYQVKSQSFNKINITQ